MKSVVMAGWLVAVGIGDIVVVIWAVIEESKKHHGKNKENPAFKFFMFAGIMFIGFLLFVAIAYFYTYVEDKEDTTEEEVDDKGKEDDEGGTSSSFWVRTLDMLSFGPAPRGHGQFPRSLCVSGSAQ